MKKIILVFVLFIIFSGRTFAQGVDYDEIFKNIPTIDVYYEQNEDPDEQAESLKYYFQSPYPLIRLSFGLSCKSVKIKQGYYLLTPRSKDGYDFVMFKQNGKIVGLVPVYEKRLLTPEEKARIFPPPPKQKTTIWSLPWRGVKAGTGKMLGKYEKPPEPPKYALDANIIGGNKYYEMILYDENYENKLLFKIER